MHEHDCVTGHLLFWFCVGTAIAGAGLYGVTGSHWWLLLGLPYLGWLIWAIKEEW